MICKHSIDAEQLFFFTAFDSKALRHIQCFLAITVVQFYYFLTVLRKTSSISKTMNSRIIATSLSLFVILTVRNASGDPQGEKLISAFNNLCGYFDHIIINGSTPEQHFSTCLNGKTDKGNVETCARSTMNAYAKEIKKKRDKSLINSALGAFYNNHYQGQEKAKVPCLAFITGALTN